MADIASRIKTDANSRNKHSRVRSETKRIMSNSVKLVFLFSFFFLLSFIFCIINMWSVICSLKSCGYQMPVRIAYKSSYEKLTPYLLSLLAIRHLQCNQSVIAFVFSGRFSSADISEPDKSLNLILLMNSRVRRAILWCDRNVVAPWKITITIRSFYAFNFQQVRAFTPDFFS